MIAMNTPELLQGEHYFTERRTATFRKEQFEYVHTGIMDQSGESWTTTGLDEANLSQVWNQYRQKHGIPFPDEISKLRAYYGLSAAKMSEVLGFGINQYRYYEGGEVPNESNARILMAIRDKKTFLEFLEASRGVIGEKEYGKIHKRVIALEDYAKPVEPPSARTGYVSFSLERVRAAVLFYINKMNGVYVTKMNKLLFYTDFLSYKRRGYGMTGLKYSALQYGPVPKNWGSVYDSIPDVVMNECVFHDQSSGIKLESDSEAQLDILTDAEKEVLEDVCSRFKSVNARNISLESHKEKGWIENMADRGIIDYSYAFDLSPF